MTTDYEHCKNVTDTTSMCYNGYKRRTFIAKNNDKREAALENLRDTLTTKYAELYWSNPTAAAVNIVKPTDNNAPGASAVNPFDESGAITATTDVYSKVYKPTSIYEPVFDLRNDANDAAGFSQIRYVGRPEQLVEIKANASLLATTTERDFALSVYVNDALVDTQLREIAKAKSTGSDDVSTNMELVFQTNLKNGDLVKVVLWRLDGAGSVAISCLAAGLRVSTLP